MKTRLKAQTTGTAFFALTLAIGMACFIPQEAGAASRADPARAGAPAQVPLKVVYHIGDGIDQAARAMGIIRNNLAAEPHLPIAVVAVGPGVAFLIDGARDQNGNPFDATVEDLTSQGVRFVICGNTLKAMQIARDHILPEVTIAETGMLEIMRLQLREGYAYIRP